MRKLAVVLALASTALASPALARDKSWYVGVEGGAMIVEDISYDIGNTDGAATVDHNYGYDVGGFIGYDLGAFRIETETSYRKATVDNYQSSVPTPVFAANGTLGSTTTNTFNGAGGSTSALSFMLNGLLDFGPDDGVQGFIGGGVGAARVKAKLAVNNNGRFLDDSDTVFAYQGMAGIRAPLTSHVDATLKYRFFTADNVKLISVGTTNNAFDGRFRTHSILGGLTYNFGSPTPPPPPIVPEAPLPPVAQPLPQTPPPVCSPGPFIVFFEWDRSDITPEAGSILDNAVTQYQSCGNAQVMLAGHADRSGSASYNVGLSQRRADAVRSYMSSHGIPDGTISTQAFGESRPRVETADGVREVQNRRVEVTYGPGSGQ